jgi:hypothetical protein
MAKPARPPATPGPAPAAALKPQSTAPHNGGLRELKPDADAIRRRAYELYRRREATGLGGTAESDWTRAESELRAR